MPTEITSKENSKVKDAVKLMNSAKARREQQSFIVEGVRLCREALDNGCELIDVMYTAAAKEKHSQLITELERRCKNAYLITEEISTKIADTVTPQGVFVVGKIKRNEMSLENVRPTGQYILLENLQDPANIGNIFRTAEALGLDGAFMTRDCCDPYNSKSMRAAMGAVFRLPYMVVDDVADAMKKCKAKNMRPVASVPNEEASKITAIRFFKGVIMCIGNEGNGLSDELLGVCGERVTIPMNGRAESLNAATAAAILMWEMVRNY